MIPQYQISRSNLQYLFLSQLLVFIPHFSRMPWWVALLLSFCMLWRVQVFRGHWSFPSKLVKTVLTLSAAVMVILGFPLLVSIEIMVGALFVAYGLKLLEMVKRRDALVIIYLSFFLIMTHFIFDQGILLALYDLAVLVILLTCLMGLYKNEEPVHLNFRLSLFSLQTLKKSFWMVIQALPLMVLMFVLLPRLPSFWHMPLQKNTPKTGMSDSMSPGDFSNLTQDSSVAFRVSFHGDVPPQEKLYWRGLVLPHFDGRKWQQSGSQFSLDNFTWYDDSKTNFSQALLKSGHVMSGEKTDYEVILEPSGAHWLFALNNPVPQNYDIALSQSATLVTKKPVKQRLQYRVFSYLNHNDTRRLSPLAYQLQTSLPAESNPRSRELALQWFKEAGLEDDSKEHYIQRLLGEFNQRFFYTLSAPKLGEHTVDEFLFDTQSGFCEHFSSSFVFMLRAVGIPARVVVGYQGGEFNPYENYLVVRQYDAHAWAEVWLENKGWVRYDPTFSVAPQRILDGFRGAFDTDDLNLSTFSLQNYSHFSLINKILLQMDSINYLWAKWVLGYDASVQANLFGRWLDLYSLKTWFFILCCVVFIPLLGLYGFLRWRERDQTSEPLVKLYRQWLRRLAKKGFELGVGETPQAIVKNNGKEIESGEKLKMKRKIVQRFYTLFYEVDAYTQDDIKQLRYMMRQVK